MNFLGYKRKSGRAGTRNYIGILSTVVCVNEVAQAIADNVEGATAFTHNQGCCQTPIDIDRVNNILIGLANNPNLSSVLFHKCQHIGYPILM
jgi:altronate dehydratase large subunit